MPDQYAIHIHMHPQLNASTSHCCSQIIALSPAVSILHTNFCLTHQFSVSTDSNSNSCRHARDGSVTSMFGTSAYQYNPRHSTAASEVPRSIKMEPNEGVVANVPQTDELVRLGKRKAWAKFLAFEVSCMKHGAQSCIVHACCVNSDNSLRGR